MSVTVFFTVPCVGAHRFVLAFPEPLLFTFSFRRFRKRSVWILGLVFPHRGLVVPRGASLAQTIPLALLRLLAVLPFSLPPGSNSFRGDVLFEVMLAAMPIRSSKTFLKTIFISLYTYIYVYAWYIYMCKIELWTFPKRFRDVFLTFSTLLTCYIPFIQVVNTS